jgi:hypothetical protein
LVPIRRADRFNLESKALDLLNLTSGEEGLPVSESMAQRNFARTPPSPKSLPGDFEGSSDLSGCKISNTINLKGT